MGEEDKLPCPAPERVQRRLGIEPLKEALEMERSSRRLPKCFRHAVITDTSKRRMTADQAVLLGLLIALWTPG